ESDASGLEEERRRVLSRISWEEKRITELQQQKEELMMEMEMEVALLEAELQMEREALQQEEGLIVELKKRHADVELKHQADKEKSAEALEVAVKAFEDLEFQHLEKESSMEEERETLLRQISSEIAEHQQTVARRKERVLKLKEEVTKMREQTEAQRRRLSEAKSESVKILNAEKGRLLGLPARYSKETGAKSFPDTLQALGKIFLKFWEGVVTAALPAERSNFYCTPSSSQNLSPMKKGRAQMLMDSEKLTGSAPCVLAATTLSILNSQKPLTFTPFSSLSPPPRAPLLKGTALVVCEDGRVEIVQMRTPTVQSPCMRMVRRIGLLGSSGKPPLAASFLLHEYHESRTRALPALQDFHFYFVLSSSLSCRRELVATADTPPPTKHPPNKVSSHNGSPGPDIAEIERQLREAIAEKERLLKDRRRLIELKRQAQRDAKRKELTPQQDKPVPSQAVELRHEERNTQEGPSAPHPAFSCVTFDLKSHLDSLGHAVETCPHVTILGTSCKGFLTKMGGKIKTWKKRWFVFDGKKRRLAYYADKEETKLKGVIYFQAIEEIYYDHLRSAFKSPNPKLTFCVKTYDRLFYMMAPTDVAMRIWMDVIVTAAD
uniref:PH domain-containing protein n=1 Tax=Latimeria chalumnae TaxID=7897 RepID=H3AD55_LATCH